MDDISSKGIMSLSLIDSKIAFRGASKKTGHIFYSLFQISFRCQDLKSHPCRKLATCWLENKVQMWHRAADAACPLSLHGLSTGGFYISKNHDMAIVFISLWNNS